MRLLFKMDFILMSCLSDQSTHQVFKVRVSSEKIQTLSFEINRQIIGALFIRSFQPGEGFLLIAEPRINDCDVVWRNVTALG